MVAVLFAIVEIPLFLVRCRNSFTNSIAYVFWNGSFGHSIVGLDYAARLYHPNRISLLFIPHPRSNEFLPACFHQSYDVYIWKGLLPLSRLSNATSYTLGHSYYVMLRFVMLTLSGLTSKFKVVERLNVYKTLSETTASLCHGDEETGTLRAYWNPTGYMRILRNGIGCAPALPQELLRSKSVV